VASCAISRNDNAGIILLRATPDKRKTRFFDSLNDSAQGAGNNGAKRRCCPLPCSAGLGVVLIRPLGPSGGAKSNLEGVVFPFDIGRETLIDEISDRAIESRLKRHDISAALRRVVP
jgi:hypothetical protein